LSRTVMWTVYSSGVSMFSRWILCCFTFMVALTLQLLFFCVYVLRDVNFWGCLLLAVSKLMLLRMLHCIITDHFSLYFGAFFIFYFGIITWKLSVDLLCFLCCRRGFGARGTSWDVAEQWCAVELSVKLGNFMALGLIYVANHMYRIISFIVAWEVWWCDLIQSVLSSCVLF
jgi:hypothetical protein